MDPKQAGTCCAKGCSVCASETGLDPADIARIDGYIRDRKTMTEQYSGFDNANLITRESRILTTAIILPRLPF